MYAGRKRERERERTVGVEPPLDKKEGKAGTDGRSSDETGNILTAAGSLAAK